MATASSCGTRNRLLTVELWLSVVYAFYNGAMVVYLTEIMPVRVRTTAFSLAYSLATALFGGFTPAISTYLIYLTQNRAMPALWLSGAAVAGLTSVMILRRNQRARLHSEFLSHPELLELEEIGDA